MKHQISRFSSFLLIISILLTVFQSIVYAASEEVESVAEPEITLIDVYAGLATIEDYYAQFGENVSSAYALNSQTLDTSVYYMTNKHSGMYMQKYLSFTSGACGTVADLGTSIQWNITWEPSFRIYYITNASNPTQYLSGYENGVFYETLSSPAEITSLNMWSIRNATGGGLLFKNAYTNKYLCLPGADVALTSSLDSAGTESYNKCVWRCISTDYYGNLSSHKYRELSSFSVSDLAIDVAERKMPSINSTPSNAIWDYPTDFYYSLLSGTSSNVEHETDTGYFSGISVDTLTYRVQHKVTGITSTLTVSVNPLLIYRTRNRETEGFNNTADINDVTPIVDEDYTYAAKDTMEIIRGCNLFSNSDFYENMYYETKISVDERVRIFRNFAISQINYDETFTPILNDMIDHFIAGSGTVYENTALTNEVIADSSSQTYVSEIVDILNDYLLNPENGMFDLQYDESLWTSPVERKTHPMVAAMIDEEVEEPSFPHDCDCPGLTLCIDSLYGNKIEIESFSVNGNTYSGTIKFTYYDHFGLDTDDMNGEHEFLFGGMAPGHIIGFRQWYILQHWDELGAETQPKPFLTNITFTVEFSGSIQ